MPFLAPLLPAVIGGIASAGAGAVASKIIGGGSAPAGSANATELNQAEQNTQGGLNQQQDFLNSLQGLTGQGINAQGQSLQQLKQGAMGQGPNPALAQLNQTTGQNVSQQASLMGSQRGVSANPGMLARQAAQQGSAIQQQAAGQAATLQAQQQMAYQEMLANQANNVVGQGQNALNAYQQGAQGNQNALLGNVNQQQAGQNALASGQQQALGNIVGGAVGGIGQTVAGMLKPNPPVQQKAQGGMIQPQAGPSSFIGQALNMSRGGHVSGKARVKGDDEKNDTVPVMLSPGEIVVPRTKSADPKKAAAFAAAVAARSKRK